MLGVRHRYYVDRLVFPAKSHIYGHVVNNSPSDETRVKVILTLYDSAGKVLAVSWVYALPLEVPAGKGFFTFHIPRTIAIQLDHYRIVAESPGYISELSPPLTPEPLSEQS